MNFIQCLPSVDFAFVCTNFQLSTFDYVERPKLLELLRICGASCGGFFAKHFPKDKPTPKQYFALTHVVELLAENVRALNAKHAPYFRPYHVEIDFG